MLGVRQYAARLGTKHQTGHVHVVAAYGVTAILDQPIKNGTRLADQAYLCANEHEARLPHALISARRKLLYLWRHCVHVAKAAIQGKHLCPIDTVGIVATSLCAEL